MLSELLTSRLTDGGGLRRGLVYSIGAHNANMSDVGRFVVHSGSDGSRLGAIVAAAEPRRARLRAETVPGEGLRKTKTLLKENSHLGLYRPGLALKTLAPGLVAGVALVMGPSLLRRSQRQVGAT